MIRIARASRAIALGALVLLVVVEIVAVVARFERNGGSASRTPTPPVRAHQPSGLIGGSSHEPTLRSEHT